MTTASIDFRSTILRLRAAIKASETHSREIRAQIVALAPQGPATGPERSDLWQQKRAHGAGTRALLLALAIVRGRAYVRVEQKCRTPVPFFDVANAILPSYTTDPATGRTAIDWDALRPVIAEVKAWVAGEAATAAVAPAEAIVGAHA